MNMIKYYFNELKKSGGCSSIVDVLWCTLRYGASPANYKLFRFAELTQKQRATFVTNRVSRKMIKKYNNPKYIYLFEDKLEFAKCFNEYFNRKYLSTDNLKYDEFSKFVHNEKTIICKPNNSAQGQGIVVYDNLKNTKKIYEDIIENHRGCILEEWIPQHQEISKLYPFAVNCLRLITVYKQNKMTILTGGLTLGVDSKIANGSQKSIICPIDLKTGILREGSDTENVIYEKHPITNEKIKGVKIPYWQEIVEMLSITAAKVPQVGYIGWDIAITPTGPIIIEGNTTPGYKYYQLPMHTKDGIGNLHMYSQFL